MGLQWITEYYQTPNADNPRTFQLDIVGFLAILGEGSVESIAQIATLSHLIYVPRLIPAPQIFIRPTRPEKLEGFSGAKVVGVHSGNTGEDIHHVAHALHRGDKLPPNTVKCVRVEENDKCPRPSIRRYGPLAVLVLIGFALSALNLAMAFVYNDGWALVATIILSFLSTTTGVANKWIPTPNDPKPDPNSPPGDVVIRYPQGAFLVVKCDERTARYLYFNPSERCIYLIKSTTIYRGLSLVSTLLLMSGVICLANATIYTQTVFAASYMSLNIFYWIGAALPPARNWDLSRLVVREVEVKGGAPPRSATVDNVPQTYTEALWKAIAVTGTSSWAREAGFTPKTPAWNDWLTEAQEAASSEPMKQSYKDEDGRSQEIWTIRNWDSRNALSTLLRTNTDKLQAR